MSSQQMQMQIQIQNSGGGSGNNNSSNIPVSEVFWTLVDKADKKFSKIRDLPFYQRSRHDTYFYKVFKVYTQLWKFQQENRQKLIEAGLKRWEIGEIASRIGQLYFGQYMRTSDANYLSESYIFYEAILTREYFKEGLFQDVNIANKQLRFLARFIMVCLVLNRREMVQQLVNQLKVLVDECKRTFQESDFKEWKLVVQEILRFLKAETAFMNIRPLRYSLVLDSHPDTLPHVAAAITKRHLKLRDAVLSSFHPNEVKYSELTIDTFRMLQCLEWEPSGLFYQSSGSKLSQNGATGTSRISYIQDIADPTLPANPRKAVLYRPSLTHFIAVLATICEELPSDGILLVYLSASGYCGSAQNESGCIHFGPRGDRGSNCIYPSDFVPFTRRPLLLVIDNDNSKAFKVIAEAEKGESVAMLLSPSCSPALSDCSHNSNGSLFTMFLTAPLQAFCMLLGLSGTDIDLDTFNKAEMLLSSSLNNWGLALATSDTLNPVWGQILGDPFIRRLLLRFIFCQAVLTLYAPVYNDNKFLPTCVPSLPTPVLPPSYSYQSVILNLASMFGATKRFIFSEDVLPESMQTNMNQLTL
ncbi:protein SCAI-like [Glycine soja]|uniref:Protein SCAI n=1 Tax=Glycine soja TaxID=3848 RepID=A0A445L9W1_GLYSO|nr:protein SCAI-like [Glycine soja]RZC19937.1 Protein SCAI [Glycine soja]